MIYRNDFSIFFNAEADAAKKAWDTLMDLPVKERIRKRKTIENVFLDENSSGYKFTEENKIKLYISFEKNLSDFKEGDALILHDGAPTIGIKCTLNEIVDDNNIVLEVFPPNLTHPLDRFYKKPLFLDKDCVDLRENVFFKFLSDLKYDKEYWHDSILNNPHAPTMEDMEKCVEELEDTCTNFELKLLDKQREAILNSMAAKDYYLVQGPPGTGKSFVLSIIILEELAFFKHKVIVIGPNHMAINNTLEQVLRLVPTAASILCKVGQLYNAPKLEVEYEGETYRIKNLFSIDVDHAEDAEFSWAIGLTPHSLYTRRADLLECDTLIIDEAGQMTIPLALMGMIRAKKVILAGDHKQLPPIISSDEISEEMKRSVFQTLMTEENCTMLDISFRMCEPICNFVSDLFYDGKVKPHKYGCGNLISSSNPLFDFKSPIIIHDVPDEGEQTSDKEAEFIVDTIAGFLKVGLPAKEIAVLSPFRAQAANIKRHFRKREDVTDEQKKLVSSDTVDKMQGQEREVIIYSFVAGNIEYMNDMADFLYNPNKLNVAFSRAKSKLVIVGNVGNLKTISHEEYPHITRMLESQYVTFV